MYLPMYSTYRWGWGWDGGASMGIILHRAVLSKNQTLSRTKCSLFYLGQAFEKVEEKKKINIDFYYRGGGGDLLVYTTLVRMKISVCMLLSINWIDGVSPPKKIYKKKGLRGHTTVSIVE